MVVLGRRRFLQAGAAAMVGGCGADDVAIGGGLRPTREPDVGTSTAFTELSTGSSESTSHASRNGGWGGDGSEGGESTGFSGHGPPAPPNIVFVVLDDVGYAALPSYGNPYVDTPTIAGLGQQGMLFRNAFLASSSCSPNRGVYLTGQYPHTNGLTGLVHRYPELALPSDQPTLPWLLRSFGYACGFQGKWHVSDEHPSIYGYDEYLNDITGTRYITSAEHAIDFIERHASRPFFLELDFMETHQRWKEHAGLEVDADAIASLEHWMMPDWPEIRELAAQYFSELRYVDMILGQVLDALAAQGLERTTMVVLTSDNGAPFPGNKITLYDRGLRTPLIVRWPDIVPAATISDAIVSSVDVPVAMAMAAASQTTSAMQGDARLFDVLRDPTRTFRDSVYAEMTYHVDYVPARAVRTDRWKYILNLSPDPWGLGSFADAEWATALLALPGHDWNDPRPPVELYDLAADPHEVDNLADRSEHAYVREEMHERLLVLAAQTHDDAFS
jgi:N-sulfoglucosamine sulfohydrolase